MATDTSDSTANNTSTSTSSNASTAETTSFTGQIPYFLSSILSTPAGALPKGPLWVAVFDFDDNIRKTIAKVRSYEPKMPEAWEVEDAINTITSRRFQETKGCMLVQSVTIPGESVGYSQEGINYNGYIRGGIGQGRGTYDTLRMTFLNTNVNFVDNVIRPWVVMTGHLGMIARPPEKKYRCNITVYRLGITKKDESPYVAQRFNFWGCCPINVVGEQYTYGPELEPPKTAEFVYHWYTTTSNKNTAAKSTTA